MKQDIVSVDVTICRQSGAEETPTRTGQEGRRFLFNTEKSLTSFSVREKDGCLLGEVKAALKGEAFRENDGFAYKEAVRIALRFKENPDRMTAMYLHRDWWTRPAFVTTWSDLPEHTQAVYLDYGDHFGCLLFMAGNEYKAQAVAASGKGTDRETLSVGMTAYCAGQMSLEEPVFVLSEADTPYEAVELACRAAADRAGVLLREKKELPEIFDYLGWCSWDAFYTDINEEKVRQKAEEFKEKDIPARWLLLDDGWLSVREERLYDLMPEKEKFPDGFSQLTEDLKKDSYVRWIGVWHSLGGYWGGIEPGSKAYREEEPHLYTTRSGKILPSPKAEAGYGFFRDWYEKLRGEGIDFVKVDGQSAVKNHFANDIPVSLAARETHKALEGAAAAYMGGRLINCMGMAMENILGRQGSALSRNSDDFVPDDREGFGEHLLQNAYNAPYHNAFYVCDWDMFWTFHPDAAKHAVLRAISGGPVYFSDRIGDTVKDAVMPLCFSDGRILCMERSAMPSPDRLFTDPIKEGVVKLGNLADCGVAGKKGGAVAVYNLTDTMQETGLCAGDIFDLPKGDYLCVDGMEKKIIGWVSESGGEVFPLSVEQNGFGLYLFVPAACGCAVVGLLEKYISFLGLKEVKMLPDGFLAIAQECGTFGFYAEKKVRGVTVNGIDRTNLLEKTNGLYRINVQGETGQMVVEVRLS